MKRTSLRRHNIIIDRTPQRVCLHDEVLTLELEHLELKKRVEELK